MIANQASEKSRLIAELNQVKTEQGVRMISQLLNLLIQETRESNDSAGYKAVLINQGKIEAYKTIIDDINRGLPGNFKKIA